MKEKFKKIVDLLIEKKNTKARTEFKKIIQQHPKYIDYNKRLLKMGLDLKKVAVPDRIYEEIKKAISGYDRAAQLAILDRAYIDISKNKL